MKHLKTVKEDNLIFIFNENESDIDFVIDLRDNTIWFKNLNDYETWQRIDR